MALRIERRSGERIQVRVGDVVAWIRVETDGSRIAVVVDGDRRLEVMREELVRERRYGAR